MCLVYDDVGRPDVLLWTGTYMPHGWLAARSIA